MSKRAIIFIDGNNLYHGMKSVKKKGLSLKKLDFVKFSQKIAKDAEWVETRFYIGEVLQEYAKTSKEIAKDMDKVAKNMEWLDVQFCTGDLLQEQKKRDADRYQKQRRFLASVQNSDDRVNYYLGRIDRQVVRRVRWKIIGWLKMLSKVSKGISTSVANKLWHAAVNPTNFYQETEKEVDVMIAVDMVSMAYEDKYDIAYLVASDSDYVRAVENVRKVGKKVVVASPRRGGKLTAAADDFSKLRKEFFYDCLKE